MRLLPTIRSRCQLIAVPTPQPAHAEKILAAAGLNDAARWLALAGGSPGLALEMGNAGQGAWLGTLLTRLGAGPRLDPLAAAAELDKVLRDGKGKVLLKQFVEAVQKWLVDLTLAGERLPPRYFLAEQGTIAGLAAMIPPARLIAAYRASGVRRQEAEQPLNARLFLEGLFLDYRALFANR